MAPNPRTCVVVSPGDQVHGKQRLPMLPGITAESAGAVGISMHLVTIPPGGRAQAHLHERHESVLYVISGESGMHYGEGLREHLTVRAGQFLYIPAGMPHQPYNPTTEPCVAVVARTDANEQESVWTYPSQR